MLEDMRERHLLILLAVRFLGKHKYSHSVGQYLYARSSHVRQIPVHYVTPVGDEECHYLPPYTHAASKYPKKMQEGRHRKANIKS